MVTKTSDWESMGVVLEYDSLEDCVNELLDNKRNFPGGIQAELVISRPGDQNGITKYDQKCDFRVEIYDTYRE